jgi:hypothetical protein
MRAPRIHCPSCGRPVALVPTRRTGYGVVHDHKTDRRSLVLCPGSMRQMPLSEADAWQDALPDLDDDQNPPARLF